MKRLVAILLSLFLGLFLADAVLSLVDDTLVCFLGVNLLSLLRELVAFFALLVALLIYVLMGLTPMIPKRQFLPITLFYPAGILALIPLSIFCYDRIRLVVWVISFCQVALGLGILCWLQGGFKFRWPLVAETWLGGRRFSWLNLSVFLLANVIVVPIAVFLYLAVCASLAVDHFSGGFLALRPGGMTVQVRKYVRADGKTIHLIPMAHIGERDFYRAVSESFPTNSIILMEGVTDNKGLLTNALSYKRAATSLGLAEQDEEFTPSRGEMVQADVDTDQFSSSTINFLNLITLLHSKGVNAGTMLELTQFSPPPRFEERLLEDLLRKRNRHLVEQIHARLPQSENIVVPWGVAHMPEVAREIQKSGFRLNETREYQLIRFRSESKQKPGV